jgi:hypothetical protein
MAFILQLYALVESKQHGEELVACSYSNLLNVSILKWQFENQPQKHLYIFLFIRRSWTRIRLTCHCWWMHLMTNSRCVVPLEEFFMYECKSNAPSLGGLWALNPSLSQLQTYLDVLNFSFTDSYCVAKKHLTMLMNTCSNSTSNDKNVLQEFPSSKY